MHLTKPPPRPQPDSLLPLINVVFLLLIFFMLMGALNAVDLFDIEPPTSASASETTLDKSVVLVGADGRLAYLDGELDDDALTQTVGDILKAKPNTLFRLKADGAAPAARVIEVMELLKAAGAERVLLLTLAPGK
jgi:biopolymer transport protein ExbD